jgi:hypothetical protein
MSEPKDGGPAFPQGACVPSSQDGMSLRDWFAGQALGAIIDVHGGKLSSKGIAHVCYDFADAMLAEREKGKT